MKKEPALFFFHPSSLIPHPFLCAEGSPSSTGFTRRVSHSGAQITLQVRCVCHSATPARTVALLHSTASGQFGQDAARRHPPLIPATSSATFASAAAMRV